jgi:2-polyprenyl-3-methyl-5-hydroxy-6-metoxy-1,4-benzoquinol methylase
MRTPYDKHYKVRDYFGEPSPELIALLSGISPKGSLLDLGCGQGRNAIPLARMGYAVTGIDTSSLGIVQMVERAKEEGLALRGIVGDMYTFTGIEEFDIILIDSMFHFTKKDREKEAAFLSDVCGSMKSGAILVICLHHTGFIYETFRGVLDQFKHLVLFREQDFNYTFHDPTSNHKSHTPYKMLAYFYKLS